MKITIDTNAKNKSVSFTKQDFLSLLREPKSNRPYQAGIFTSSLFLPLSNRLKLALIQLALVAPVLFTPVLFSPFLVAPALAAPAPPPPTQAGAPLRHPLLLKQKLKLLGDFEALVTQQGLRVNLPVQNLVMFNRKGSKDVCVLNTRTKQYYLGPVQDWHYNTSGTALISPSDASQLKIVSRHGEDLQGIKTVKTKLSGETIDKTPGEMRKHRWQQLIVKEGELWSLPAGAISKESALMASRLLATPRNESYPLQLYLYKNRRESKPSKVLELLSWKTARVENNSFIVPAGYKQAQNEVVLYGQIKGNLLDELLK